MARTPEASERISHAPVRLLRAVFSGVGQLLLAADRLRAEEAGQEAASLAGPGPAGPLDTAGAHSEPVQARPGVLKITGNGDHDPAAARAAGRAAKTGRNARTGKARRPASSRSGLAGSDPQHRSGSAATAGASQSGTSRAAKSGKTARSGTASGSQASKKPRRGSRQQQRARFRSLDSTGNVRVLSEQDIADLAEDELNRKLVLPSATPGPGEHVTLPGQQAPAGQAVEPGGSYGGIADAVASAGPTGTALSARAAATTDAVAAADAGCELPIADYDGLSLASLRARLRNLTIDQLEVLSDYEARHANRREVISMFGNRITKLRTGPR